MQDMNFLAAKYNLNDKQNIINTIEYYADRGCFFEAYNYLNHAMYFHDMSQTYYSLLTKYLSERRESKNILSPLLITWTVTPKNVPFLYMTDPEERLRENMLGLAAWILDKSFTNIVITESSEFKLDEKRLTEIGLEHNKILRYLSFKGSDGVSRFGKGYGEGEITKHALENSVIGRSKRFTKMTGKQYSPFYEYTLISGGETFEYFNMHHLANKVSIDTRMYCIDTNYYKENMVEAYKEVDDFKDNYLEIVFYEKVKDRLNYFLPKEPIVFGKQGSINKNYGDYPSLVHEFSAYLLKELI